MDENIKNYVLVGRPNVGKSSLFNFLVKKHEAFVRDEEGTTVDWRSKKFGNIIFWDTPGVFDIEQMPPCNVDKIIFVIEHNVLTYDKEIYKALQRKYKDILVVVNKIDKSKNQLQESYDFFQNRVLISLKNRIGLDDLKKGLNLKNHYDDKADVVNGKKIWAVVGKPNVGKSSLINLLAKKEIHKVEDFEGTTKEFLPVDLEDNVLLDTPGQRHKANFPKYSNVFGILFVMDLKQERQDLRLLDMLHKRLKPIIVLINKTDLATGDKIKKAEEKISKLWNIPIMRISCKSGFNVAKLDEMIVKQENDFASRIKTSELNAWLKKDVYHAEPKLKFITQIDTCPPKFFLDYKLDTDKERMFKKRLTNHFHLKGIPILLKYKIDEPKN